MNKGVIIGIAVVVLIIILGLAYYMLSGSSTTATTAAISATAAVAAAGGLPVGAQYKDGGNTIWTVSSNGVTINANRTTNDTSIIYNAQANTFTFSPSGAVYNLTISGTAVGSTIGIKNSGGSDTFTRIA